MRRGLGLLLSAVLSGGCLTTRGPLPPVAGLEVRDAQPALPVRGPRRSFVPPLVRVEELDNALTVYTVELDAPGPSVALLSSPRGASTGEGERMVLDIAGRALQRRLGPGAAVRTGATASHVFFAVSALPDQLGVAAERLAGAAARHTVPGDTYRREHIRYLEAVADRSQSYRFMTRAILARGRYGDDHPWGRDASGRVGALAGVDEAFAKAHWRSFFAPQGSALVIVRTRALAGGARPAPVDLTPFAALRGARPRPVVQKLPPLRGAALTHTHAMWYRSPQAYLRMLHLGPPASEVRAHAAFELIAEVLGNFLSESNQSLRHQRGATYGIHSWLVGRASTTELHWGGWLEPRALVAALDQHREQLEALQEGLLREDDLARARARLRARRERLWQDPMALATHLAERFALGQAPQLDAEIYDAITPEELYAVARRYLHPERLDVAVIGPPSLYRPLLRRGRVFVYTSQPTKGR